MERIKRKEKNACEVMEKRRRGQENNKEDAKKEIRKVKKKGRMEGRKILVYPFSNYSTKSSCT